MDIQKEREVFEEWVDSEFNDHNWYLESKNHRNLHQYREELDDYWQYEETLLWSAWQADKAQAVPEGYVLMPIKPTKTMVMAVAKEHEGDIFLPYSLYDAFVKQAVIEAQEPDND